MAPPHGVLSAFASVTVVATAVTSVKTAVDTAKEAVGNMYLKRCGKCQLKINEADMLAHLEKHQKDEEEKEELAHRLRLLEIEIKSMEFRMQQKESSMEEKVQRREQELAELKAQMDIICDLCKECIHLNDDKKHANMHRQANASHSHNEEKKSDMRQESKGKRGNKRK